MLIRYKNKKQRKKRKNKNEEKIFCLIYLVEELDYIKVINTYIINATKSEEQETRPVSPGVFA